MNPSSIEIQELALVVAAKNHNPTIVNPDFLKCSGIVPANWELARAPLYSQQAVQLVFHNGVSILAQADRVMFVEGLNSKALQDVEIAAIARKYIEVLPHADYQAVGINFRSFVPFNQNVDGARQYISTKLLAPGTWQEFGQEPVRSAINFVYTLEQRQLYLSISEAALQLPENETTPIVIFSGNFAYEKAGVENLMPAIDSWQKDLEVYRDLINQRFLNSGNHSTWSLSTPEVVPLGV